MKIINGNLFLGLITLIVLSSVLTGCGPTLSEKREEWVKNHLEYMKKMEIVVPEKQKIKVEETYDKGVYKISFDRLSLEQGPVELKFKGDNGELLELAVFHGLTIEDQAKGDPIYIFRNGNELGKYREMLGYHVNYHCNQIKTSTSSKANNQSQDSSNSSSANTSESAFMTDFNTVMSRQYRGLYAGSKLAMGNVGAGHIRIYITPLWYSLNEGEKNAFVTQTCKWYLGMLGARSMSYSIDQLDFYFKDANTETTVAKWGSIRGVVIHK